MADPSSATAADDLAAPPRLPRPRSKNDLPAWMQDALTELQCKPLFRTERHACIFAVAGSGKTRTLANYVAYDIARGIPPSQIVAFTFNERAASELRARVEALLHDHLGGVDATELYVGTIHAWALQYLLDRPEFYNIEPLDELQVDSLISRLYDELGLSASYGMEFPRAIGKFAKDLEIFYNEDLQIADVPEQIRSSIQAFEDIVRTSRLLPFGAMITRAAQNLKEIGAPSIQRLYCDEYQDVNPAQVHLMQAMVSEVTEVVVVGDDLQCIYQWRGSDVGRILRFDSDFPDSSEFPLTDNFRSRPQIVRAANAIGSTVSVRVQKQMDATRSETAGRDILWLSASGEEEEATLIAQAVELLMASGVPPSKIAVLLRSVINRGRPIARAFTERGIPFESPILGRQGGFIETFLIPIFDWLTKDQHSPRTEAEEAEQYERLQVLWSSVEPWLPKDGSTNRRFWTALNKWRGQIDRKESAAYDVRGRLYDLMNDVGLRIGTTDHDLSAGLGIGSQIIRSVEEIHRRRVGSIPRRGPHRVTREVLYALRREAPRFGESAPIAPSSDAVLITTIHQSKGLEWPVVIVPALEKNFFPHASSSHGTSYRDAIAQRYGTSLDDETRLFYVATTRARERFLLFDSSADRTDRRSSFLETLRLPGPEMDTSSVPSSVWRLSPDDLRETDPAPLEIGLSDLLLAVECPFEYGLRARAQIQPAVADELGYGKGLHEIIQRRFDDGIPWTDETRRTNVNQHVHLPLMSATEESKSREAIDRRIASLEKLNAFTGDLDAEVEVEVHLRNGFVRGVVDGVLRDSGGTSRIRDWKTNIHPGLLPRYVMQLRFYAHALNMRGQEVRTGELVDVGKTLERGEMALTPVSIGPSEINQLLEHLENALEAIRSGVFSPTPSDVACGACDMYRICAVRWQSPKN